MSIASLNTRARVSFDNIYVMFNLFCEGDYKMQNAKFYNPCTKWNKSIQNGLRGHGEVDRRVRARRVGVR